MLTRYIRCLVLCIVSDVIVLPSACYLYPELLNRPTQLLWIAVSPVFLFFASFCACWAILRLSPHKPGKRLKYLNES